MKKIPTLFERKFENHRIISIEPNLTPGCECVLNGECTATVKWDGACCAVLDGIFYKRYDAKKGRAVPKNAIPCQKRPDPITGHFPCWVRCSRDNPDDKWFWNAYDNYCAYYQLMCPPDGTYEAVGLHFRNNPYKCTTDTLKKHGTEPIMDFDVQTKPTFGKIRLFLASHNMEGIVFWKNGEPVCKIKRTDFGFSWNHTPKRI